MTKHTSSFASLLTCLLLSVGALSADEPSPLAGTWVNTNPDTQSAPKIEIQIDNNGKGSFVWWGKTHPEDSKYGPFDLKLYGKSVGDNQPPSFGTAVHETHFSKILFTLELDGGYLKVQMFTEFTDDSGRKPYCDRMAFKRK
ncbi:hypothetical protein VSU19_07460 [Verrucomicrobiales bacterium BCK34]|nr:hypothetical protein [Verrucomicrobiales bacterium BCK34]